MELINKNMVWKSNINYDELYDRYISEIQNKNDFLSHLHTDDVWSSGEPWRDWEQTKEEYIKKTLRSMMEIDYHFNDSNLDILANLWISPHSDKGGIDEEFTAFYILKSNGHYLNDIPFKTGDILIVNIHEIHSVRLQNADNTMLLSQDGVKDFIDKHMMVANYFNFNATDNLTKKDIEERFVSLFDNDKKPSFSM